MRASFLINARQRKHFSSAAHCEANMPPKSKRKQQLENARAAKSGGEGSGGEGSSAENQSTLEEPSLDQDEESQSEDDADFDPDSTLNSDQKQKMAEEFIQEWVSVLSRDDLMSLVITLNHLLDQCGVLQTAAASKIATLIGKGERTVREWRSIFLRMLDRFLTVNKDTTKGKAFFGRMKSSVRLHVTTSEAMQ